MLRILFSKQIIFGYLVKIVIIYDIHYNFQLTSPTHSALGPNMQIFILVAEMIYISIFHRSLINIFCIINFSFKKEQVNGSRLIHFYDQLTADRRKFETDFGKAHHLRFMQMMRFCDSLCELHSVNFQAFENDSIIQCK